MGLLDILFGSKINSPSKANEAARSSEIQSMLSFNSGFLEIKSIGFFGQFKKSKSGEWIIGWSDSDEKQHVGGYRKTGHGRYVLYNSLKNELVLQGKLERPNSGHVANNGCFSIEDWHFGGNLSGTFYVISPSGSELIKKKLSANIFNSGISDEGRYAICQTANNPQNGDGNRLVAFDIERGAELFSVHPITEWADSYKFIEDIPYFFVVIDKIGEFRYDSHGSFLDTDKYASAKLNCDRYDIVLLAAEETLKKPQPDSQHVKAVLAATLRALTLGANNDQSWKAFALKVQGLAHEHLNNDNEALSAFEEALKINPKIGVKRKADALRIKLGQV